MKAAGCSAGIQTQASFSGASASANPGPRDAQEPQSLRGLGDVGNAGLVKSMFPQNSQGWRILFWLRVLGSLSSFLSCHPLSQSAGSLLPVGSG